MSTLLTARPHEHERQLNPQTEQIPVRRVSLLDRLALHVGLALIKWGRRPLERPSRERRANRIEQTLAALERQRFDERAARLLLPIR